MERNINRIINVVIILIYIVFLCFFVFKGLHYQKYVSYVPDEQTHLSYVVYMKENPYKFVPDFENIRYMYLQSGDDKDLYYANGETCQLGHSPFYYKIMAMLGEIEIVETNECARVNMRQLRIINLVLSALGMILFCYIGYSRISHNLDNISEHILYAAISTGIPMIALCASGVTNDNLIYIGFALFLLGVIRYYEEKVDIKSYLLVAVGFLICMMTKLTAGFAVCVVLLLILVSDWISNKMPKVICCKNFVLTIPIYMIAVVYYALVFLKYKTIQPSLQLLNPEQYYNSNWYIPVENRVPMTFEEYLKVFIDTMASTWTSIYNGAFFYFKKAGSFEWWPFVLLVELTFVYILYEIIISLQKKKKTPIWLIACVIGSVAMMVQNFITCYNYFLNSGRVGGAQGRYYVFFTPVFALANVYFFSLFKKNKWSKVVVNILLLLYAIWIVYADFIYNINTYGVDLSGKI